MKNRTSNRLQNYDYSQNGMYFVTICTRNREELFGEIENGKIILSDLGKIIEKYYLEIPKCHPYTFLDVFVIMPNHLHGIIEINRHIAVGADLVSARNDVPAQNVSSFQLGQTQGLSLQSLQPQQNIGLLSRTIQGFKSKSAVEHINIMRSKSTSDSTKIWQRSFYDRIIRNDAELNRIREYILVNPAMWERDRNNAENIFI
jgi:putative transposase